MTTPAIRPVAAGDKAAWLHLWHGYLAFYDKALDPKITEATWRRLLDESQPIHGLVALDGTTIFGFANYVLHPGTWTDRPVCYLEDLFVAPDARGHGAGRALIESLVERAKALGWYRIYWQTRQNNASARRLYDRMTPATDWVRYDIAVTTD